MAVRIRMKQMGRCHQPFFRICAVDARTPRSGKVLEELGTYDPLVKDTDARAVLKRERVAHWLSVGALPTEKVGVLIKKYGPEGTRIAEQEAALSRLAQPKAIPEPGRPASLPKSSEPEAEPTPAPEAEAAPVEASAAPSEATPETQDAAAAGEAVDAGGGEGGEGGGGGGGGGGGEKEETSDAGA